MGKTGVVVENMDHDKVLIKMDGSRRLTTRNRRFVKKIISPQDLPDQNVMQAPSVPVMLDDAEEVPTAGVDIEDRNVMGDEGGVQQQDIRQDETVAVAGGGIPGDSGQPDIQAAEERIDVQTRSPSRPQRTRKPNVRYSQEEYDLTTISGHINQARISGISVRRYGGQSGGIESRTLGLITSHCFRTGRR